MASRKQSESDQGVADSQVSADKVLPDNTAAPTGSELPEFRDDGFYLVQLARPIKIGSATVSPSALARMSGAACKQFRSDIQSAEEIKNGREPSA